MTKTQLFELKPDGPDMDIYNEAKKRFDSLAKPIDGFGYFEDLICRVAAIQGRLIPDIKKRAVIVMCSDNGVTREGISQTDSKVTLQVARLLGKKESTLGILTRGQGIDIVPVDIGIDTDEKISGVIDKKIARGSADMLEGPAMTEDQCILAIQAGIDTVKMCVDKGYTILATGEMGIGNTTTSTALLCALTGDDPKEHTGRGAGLSDEGLARKISVINKALKMHGLEGNPKKEPSGDHALFALGAVGGFDIAALCGVFIGCSMFRIPVVIDGLISAVAALTAQYLVPGCAGSMLASHNGREKGTDRILQLLNLKGIINADMALGEGTGSVMLFPLIDMVMNVYADGHSFEETGIREYERFSK
ncbi:MAG: nicotinate-nucleotide--dimethylbenzimidazole phosphoribosyltransferase [Lachnospiraceae bacterium]|nr:nicotinate-nucleotide--dimethylbenzimidazole phosphoribosyltransferase [Lachnospiraceae bacterium]